MQKHWPVQQIGIKKRIRAKEVRKGYGSCVGKMHGEDCVRLAKGCIAVSVRHARRGNFYNYALDYMRSASKRQMLATNLKTSGFDQDGQTRVNM